MEMRNVTEVAVQMDPPLDEELPSVQSGRAQQICRWFRSIFVSSEPNTDAEFLPDADIELGDAHGPQRDFTQDPFADYDLSAFDQRYDPDLETLPIAVLGCLLVVLLFLYCAIFYTAFQLHPRALLRKVL